MPVIVLDLMLGQRHFCEMYGQAMLRFYTNRQSALGGGVYRLGVLILLLFAAGVAAAAWGY